MTSSTSAASNNTTVVHGLVICSHLAILILLYSQTYFFDYAYYDDFEYILGNSAVRSGLTLDGILWSFTNFYLFNWHPLTFISYMIDISLFGEDPGWAHVHNFILHGMNSLLVYCWLLKLSGNWWKACALSIVFLAHPLHVESVAWIAERKDVLCGLFFLLGLLLYDNYRARPRKLQYFWVLMAYAMALMSKPMAVTFPIVLLILDLFIYRDSFVGGSRGNQAKKAVYFQAIIEKLPLLALSAISSVVTIMAQDTAVVTLEALPLASRWAVATSGYLTYLKQFLFPVDLAVFYPLPLTEPTLLADLLFPSVTLFLLIILSIMLISKLPLLAAGLCFYLVTLLPVIGLVQVSGQAHADRYMYLPSIGVLIACVYLVPSARERYFPLGSALWVVFIVYLTIISYWQVGYWKNRHTLFNRVQNVSGPLYVAYIELARDYMMRGMLEEARQQILEAMAMAPFRPDAYEEMGNVALKEQEFPSAENLYRRALSVSEGSHELHNNLGIALAEQGHIADGLESIQMALKIEPKSIEAQQNLALYQAKLIKETTQ